MISHSKEIFEYINRIEDEFSPQKIRLEEEIKCLKTQLEESKRTEEVMKT
jgi:hypothetical protein